MLCKQKHRIILYQGCHQSRNGLGIKFFKVRELYFEFIGKIDVLKKSQGNIFNTADLIPLKVGRNIWGLNLLKTGKKNQDICCLNGQVERMVASLVLLLDLTFCIYLVREILFLSGKSHGILKSDACGNHVYST